MKIKELGHVVLYVKNLEQSANFYRDTLGFNEIFRDDFTALFSSGRTHHELLLIGVGGEIKKRTISPGLYHIGLKIGDGHVAIKKVWEELNKKGIKIVGTGDHTVTHSIYILDPDGNELELYADMGKEWKKNPKAIMTPVKPLDLSF